MSFRVQYLPVASVPSRSWESELTDATAY